MPEENQEHANLNEESEEKEPYIDSPRDSSYINKIKVSSAKAAAKITPSKTGGYSNNQSSGMLATQRR